MLIQALCAYDDLLAKAGKLTPEGYSRVPVHHRVSLTPEGKIDGVEAWMIDKTTTDKKGKEKIVQTPHVVQVFRRTEKPGIEANYLEFRPVYLFGLMPDKAGQLSSVGEKGKAQKSHQAFVERSLAFTEGIHSPMVDAFRAFVEGWRPENETENPFLKALGKDYASTAYVFCLSGQPAVMLQDDPQLIARWEALQQQLKAAPSKHMGQCAVTGQQAEIAEIHDKIAGMVGVGGLAMGTKLVSFKNPSESSYGAENSLNSNISTQAMQRYTRALNYLMGSPMNHSILGDLMLVRFAMSADERYDALTQSALFGQSLGENGQREAGDMDADGDDDADADTGGALNAADTERLLADIYQEARRGAANADRLLLAQAIDPAVDYYIVGLKPNSSRLSVKFIYRRRLGDMIQNAARHQADMAVSVNGKPVALWQIAKELISPKATKATVNPALSAKLLEAVVYGRAYPPFLLATMVRRVCTDSDSETSAFVKLNPVRAGVIKACLNRSARLKGQKEEINMALDKENTNPAYLCGRLFAVLEKIQEQANPGLNRTITDAYFASAAANPSVIFPRLMKLSQNHLKKLEYAGYWNRRAGEIIGKLGGEYPGMMALPDQGRFIIGYYQEKYAPSEKKQADSQSDKEDD